MPTIEITTTDYGPESGDENPSTYLVRASEAITEQYGYFCTLKLGKNTETNELVRQLQITIPDESVGGGKRQVTVTAPEVVVDVNGDIMTESAFNAKYGS